MQAIAEQKPIASTELSGTRILVIMPSIPVQGMERANLQIMKMMRERGADVLFITEQNHGHLLRSEVEAIGCHWVGASLLNSFEERLHLTMNPLQMAKILRAWVRATWQIDGIYREYKPTHIYLTNVVYVLYTLITLWRARQPIILRLPNPPALNSSGWRGLVWTLIWKYGINPVCDVIVCNSQYSFAQLRKIGTEKERLIYNCLPERPPTYQSDAPKVNPRHFNIVYLGRIRPEKGVRELFDVALRVVTERDDVDFYFAGEHHWMNPFAEALIKEVRAKHLHNRIQFTGEIVDVFGLLRQCDLHVCPSVSQGESFPNVLLEAKAHSLASVVFRTAGIPQAVTHLVDGYICREKSANALYEGIYFFLDSPPSLKAAGEAALKSLDRFSRDRIADQWADVFKSA